MPWTSDGDGKGSGQCNKEHWPIRFIRDLFFTFFATIQIVRWALSTR